MKKLPVLVVLIANCFFGFSQNVNRAGDSVQFYLGQAKEYMFRNTKLASYYIDKAKTLNSQIGNDKLVLAELLLFEGRIQYVKGDYVTSYKALIDSRQIYMAHGKDQGAALALNVQGLIIQTVGNHEEAINYFEEGIAVFSKAGKEQELPIFLINIGGSQLELEQYNSARDNFSDALAIALKYKQYNNQHIAKNKLGTIAIAQGNYEAALEYFTTVITHEHEPNAWERSYAYNGMAEAYYYLKQYKVAEEYALKGLYYGKGVKALWDIEQSYRVLYHVYEENDNFEKALKYHKFYDNYKDSLYNQKRLNQLALLELKKDEAEKKRLVAENEYVNEKLHKNRIYIALILALVLFLILLLVQHRKRMAKEKRLHMHIKLQNAELETHKHTIEDHNKILVRHNNAKDKLISIISHDLRAPVGSMEQLLELMVDGNFSEDERNELIEELLIQVRSTSYLLNDLLKWAKLQLEGVNSKPVKIMLVGKVDTVLSSFYLTIKRKEIKIVHSLPESGECYINADEAHVNIIVHNLISNAIKYTNFGKSITISYQETDVLVKLSILNEGVVISGDKLNEIINTDAPILSVEGTAMEKGEGIGLLLIKRFLKENNGTLSIVGVQDKGTEFIISFPKEN